MMCYRELESKEVRCRKAHSCGWCAEAIRKGEVARFRKYINDGQWVNEHLHLECYGAMMSVPARDLAEGWMPGDFIRGSTEWV